MTLQKIRRFTLIISMLLFPITIYYFSPYLIIMSAMQHIINGSFIVFSLMFILGIFFGRLWCGFFCPTGGMCECFAQFSDKAPKQGWRNYIKYVIWLVWLSGIIICHVLGNGDYTVQPFFMTEHGISISNIYSYVIYYGIVILFLIPALIHGKRANCHYICWMAPFMVIGSTVGRWLHLPQLHVAADRDQCMSCGKCSRACPMGLDVKQMVSEGTNSRNTECIQCGACVDECPKKVLKYRMKWR